MSKGKISDADRDSMAQSLIAEAAEFWDNTEDAYVLKEGSAYTFTFVIRRGGGNTVISYNPLEEVKSLVESVDLQVGSLGVHEDERAEVVSNHVGQRLFQMLHIARQHFEDSLWQLENIAFAQVRLLHGQAYAKPAAQKQYINDVARMFDERLRKNLVKPLVVKLDGPDAKFTDLDAKIAIRKLGGRPSRRALARELGVSPQTILNWARRRGFEKLDDLLDQLEKWGKK